MRKSFRPLILNDLSCLKWPLGISLVSEGYIMVGRILENGIYLNEKSELTIRVTNFVTTNACGPTFRDYTLKFDKPLFAWLRVKSGTSLKFVTIKSLHEWVTIGEIASE